MLIVFDYKTHCQTRFHLINSPLDTLHFRFGTRHDSREKYRRNDRDIWSSHHSPRDHSPMSRDGHLSMKSRRCVLLFTATVATATPRRNMPNKDRCCVPLCHNKRSAESRRRGITFHRFPAIKKAKKDWVIKIRRDVGKFFKVSRCFLFALFHILHKLVHFFPPAADRGC